MKLNYATLLVAAFARVSCLGYETVDTCITVTDPKQDVNYVQQNNIRELPEVVVNAERFIRTPNGITIFPNKAQRNHTSSGHELIRSMMIPGVSVNNKSGDISALGGTVSLYVDGMPADSREVRLLRPRDVLKVEYMDAPTGKYAGNNVVINFVLKPKDHGGYIALDALQRVGYTNGDYNLASKGYRNNTQYTLFAGTDYTNVSGSQLTRHECILFPNATTWRDYNTTGSRLEKNSQYAQLRVRNKTDRSTLRATLSFVRDMVPCDFIEYDLSYTGLKGGDTAVESTRKSSSRNYKYSLGLSGSFKLTDNQLLETSASATATRNNFAYSYQESVDEITSSTKEDYYNITANIAYEIKFKHGNSLMVKASELLNVSSANYYGKNESWQHLWSSESLLFGEYMHSLGRQASVRLSPGLSAQYYRLHGNDLMKYFGPRLKLVFTMQPTRRQFIQLQAFYGNSFPQLSYMSGAVQQVDIIQLKKGNTNLKQSGMIRFMAVYGIGFNNVNLQAAGIYNGATKLPVTDYFFENGMLVQSFLPNGKWDQVDASLSATWTPVKNLNLQLSGCWLYNRYSKDAYATEACWKGSAQLSYYIGAFSINGNVESPYKVIGYDLVETTTPWTYGLSVSWSHKGLRIEAATNNLFSRKPVYKQSFANAAYRFKNTSFDMTDHQSAYIKVYWTLDFGKKTSHDKRNIDRAISTGVIKPDQTVY